MKILMTLLGRIGDMILLTPSFRLIKEKYPDAKIDVIASRHNFVIPKLNPDVNFVYVYDKKLLNVVKLIIKLRSAVYDFYVDPKDHFSRESYFFSKIVRAKTKIGFNREGYSNFDIPIDSSEKNINIFHSVRILKALLPLGIEIPELYPKPILYEDFDSQVFVEHNFPKLSNGRKMALLNISASKVSRMWQIDNWQKFVSEFSQQNIFFVITSEPRHRHLAKTLVGEHSSLFPSRNLNDIISLVRKVDVVVTPDTSIVHIASAWNKPTFGIYRGDESSFWWFRPVSDYNRSVVAPSNKDVSDIDYTIVRDEFIAFLDKLT